MVNGTRIELYRTVITIAEYEYIATVTHDLRRGQFGWGLTRKDCGWGMSNWAATQNAAHDGLMAQVEKMMRKETTRNAA